MVRARKLISAFLVALGALALTPLPAEAWSHGGHGGHYSGHHFEGDHFAHHRFHHHHFGFGLFAFGPPLFWGPPPYYYYGAPRYVVPDQGVVYVQKFEGKPGPGTPANQVFCPGKGGYYPQVQDCPGGWQRVTR